MGEINCMFSKALSYELHQSVKTPHLGSPLAEQHDKSQVSCSSWEAQWVHAIFRHHVYASAELEQQGGNFLVPKVALDTKHRSVVQDLRAVIHVSTTQHQQTAHLMVQIKLPRQTAGSEQSFHLCSCFILIACVTPLTYDNSQICLLKFPFNLINNYIKGDLLWLFFAYMLFSFLQCFIGSSAFKRSWD